MIAGDLGCILPPVPAIIVRTGAGDRLQAGGGGGGGVRHAGRGGRGDRGAGQRAAHQRGAPRQPESGGRARRLLNQSRVRFISLHT